ncbi:FAD-dependent oxidoreductase [Propionibacteriaceae bacterium Y2011]
MARAHRVAIIGAGPAGLFAAQALTARDDTVEVDIYDRLPTPYGLLRYGVAPDHTGIKRVAETLAAVFESRRVRFIGMVELGRDVTREELCAGYDAVVYALGASADAHLDVAGEELVGSLSAREFVAWYDGHPDAAPVELAGVREAVVVGVGNVAVDVARVLLKPVAELADTDMPDPVLGELDADRVTDVWVVGRRGPRQTAFTAVELRELANLAEVEVTVDGATDEELSDDEGLDRRTRTVVTILREAAARTVTAPRARLHFLFWHRVWRIDGDTEVASVRLERTEPGTDHRLRGTEHYRDLPAQLVLRAIGYRGRRLPGLPFDPVRGVIPNVEGRVTDAHGTVQPGEYVAGWIKRGATGVIGTNKSDAVQTVTHLLTDLAATEPRDLTDVPAQLAARGKQVADFAAWLRVDAAERDRGEAQGRIRTKVATWRELTEVVTVADLDWVI